MSTEIINATPLALLQGTKDSSTTVPVLEPEQRPTHCPLTVIFAERGPTTGVLASGASREVIFGSKTFDVRSKYAQHHLIVSNAMQRRGNASQMYQRLRPADAPDPATLRISLDVLETDIPLYERNAEDGSIVYDSVTNLPVETGDTVPGFKVMMVAEEILPDPVTNEDMFGKGTIGNGAQVDVSTGAQSRKFPIRDLRVSDFGAYGNNIGARIYAPTTRSSIPVDQTIIEEARAYPYRFQCLERRDEYTLPKIVETLSAEQYIDGCFKVDAYSRRLDQDIFVGDLFIPAWERKGDPQLPDTIGPFGNEYIYTNYIDTLVKDFYEAEVNLMPALFSDFRNDGSDEEHVFNFIGGTTSTGVPYYSYQIDRSNADAVILSENSVQYARGGGDGTMTAQTFDLLAREFFSQYGDPNSHLQDTARRVESVLYDTGFSLDTKYEMLKFIALRKNTNVILTPFDIQGPVLTSSQENSLAISIRTRALMFPESNVFGTPTFRAHIMGRSGTYLEDKWRGNLPLTIELASKFAAYMGAGNGFWEGTANPEPPNHIVDTFAKINVTFTPITARNKDWDAGLMTVQSYDTKRVMIPAYKSVYPNDTSIFTSMINAFIVAELETVAEQSWRNHTGISKMTDQQLCDSIDREIRENVVGRFDDRVIIIPESTITGRDAQRGFSWKTNIKLYAGVMKTVGTYSIEGFRIVDAPADQGVRA
ncbi:MAG: hypothetical protein M0R77_00735 [Gammaproteobacteria bacterium]|nr:hypothetical protein [Acholeplasmataceae bacterium]MCK9529080.1 hypothetical protein [Gammaproteobacteria bacterium]